MGVPNTTTFTLQNVVDVVDNDDNLVGVFNDAVASKFDSAYSGAKNNLLNFRNYDGGLPSFLGSVNGTNNTCSLAMNITYYHNGSGTNPAVGDTVYTDSGGTAPTQNDIMRGNFGSGGSFMILKSDQTPKPGIVTTLQECTPP